MIKLRELQSPWLDRRGAAQYLGCGTKTIDRARAQGKIVARYLNSKPLYRVQDLDKLPTTKPEAP